MDMSANDTPRQVRAPRVNDLSPAGSVSPCTPGGDASVLGKQNTTAGGSGSSSRRAMTRARVHMVNVLTSQVLSGVAAPRKSNALRFLETKPEYVPDLTHKHGVAFMESHPDWKAEFEKRTAPGYIPPRVTPSGAEADADAGSDKDEAGAAEEEMAAMAAEGAVAAAEKKQELAWVTTASSLQTVDTDAAVPVIGSDAAAPSHADTSSAELGEQSEEKKRRRRRSHAKGASASPASQSFFSAASPISPVLFGASTPSPFAPTACVQCKLEQLTLLCTQSVIDPRNIDEAMFDLRRAIRSSGSSPAPQQEAPSTPSFCARHQQLSAGQGPSSQSPKSRLQTTAIGFTPSLYEKDSYFSRSQAPPTISISQESPRSPLTPLQRATNGSQGDVRRLPWEAESQSENLNFDKDETPLGLMERCERIRQRRVLLCSNKTIQTEYMPTSPSKTTLVDSQ